MPTLIRFGMENNSFDIQHGGRRALLFLQNHKDISEQLSFLRAGINCVCFFLRFLRRLFDPIYLPHQDEPHKRDQY